MNYRVFADDVSPSLRWHTAQPQSDGQSAQRSAQAAAHGPAAGRIRSWTPGRRQRWHEPLSRGKDHRERAGGMRLALQPDRRDRDPFTPVLCDAPPSIRRAHLPILPA